MLGIEPFSLTTQRRGQKSIIMIHNLILLNPIQKLRQGRLDTNKSVDFSQSFVIFFENWSKIC